MAAMCETNIETNDVLAMVKNVTKYHLGETMGFPGGQGRGAGEDRKEPSGLRDPPRLW